MTISFSIFVKLVEHIANRAKLGWLIDPIAQQVYVYRPDVPMQLLDRPVTLSGDPVLPGFKLDLSKIW